MKTVAGGVAGVCKLMVDVGLATTNSEARRLIEGNAVEREGEMVTDPQTKWDLKTGDSFVLKAGKKMFVKVQVQ